MDVRLYFRKIREAEGAIKGTHTIVSSLETPDGGKPGVRTEVSRLVAAKLLVEGRARLATEDEAKQYFDEQSAAREESLRAQTAERVHVTVVSERDLGELRSKPRTQK
jgi:hypothetical protein